MDIILIDHYDSFSMNVLDWLERAGFSVLVCHHDSSRMARLIDFALESASSGAKVPSDDVLLGGNHVFFPEKEWSPRIRNLLFSARGLPLVFGPGPKAPKDYPNSLKLLSTVIHRWPVFGLCLGHQMLGTVAGLKVERSQDPHHGSQREIFFDPASPLFRGLKSPMLAASYNSLVVCGEIKDPWHMIAHNQFGEIEALENLAGAGAFGVQFHPESFLSPSGLELAKRWYDYINARG